MICPKCNKEVLFLTRDHIIPESLIRFVGKIGLSKMKFKKNSAYYGGISNIEMICEKCNRTKGNYVDWKDPIVREYIYQIANNMLEKLLNSYE